MYTIKQASLLTGVPIASLRAWERRYAIAVPQRNASGYRVYCEQDVALISTMRDLVEHGWAPADAAEAIRNGTVQPRMGLASGDAPVATDPVVPGKPPHTITHMQRFLSSAARLDASGIEESLDGGFALGSFEHVVDSWLFPTLEALGEGWARGEIDVAGEHAASHAVQRRLAAAFDAAGSRARGPRVVVGLPSGSQHDLGALAFATAIRRRGLDVLYLGANVPVSSWEAAVLGREAKAAVLAVVTPEDRPAAVAVAERLLSLDGGPIVCSGGSSAEELAPGVHLLAPSIGESAEELDNLLHGVEPSSGRVTP